MFSDLYNIIYLVTVGAWITCYQHLFGTYQKGIVIGLSDSVTILFSYLAVSIDILLGTLIYLAW